MFSISSNGHKCVHVCVGAEGALKRV